MIGSGATPVLLALELNPEEFSEAARIRIAVKLHEVGLLSTGAAAELADMPEPLLPSVLANCGVHAIDLWKEELRRDRVVARHRPP